MAPWSSERVAALAPDPASASAGQALASERKWASLGQSDRAIWGLCQGSGKQPYQARVDLAEPAFKCSCPSRKFPCKHGLGLLLLFARNPAAFPSGIEPGWVGDWLTDRVDRATKKTEQAASTQKPDKPVDLESQAGDGIGRVDVGARFPADRVCLLAGTTRTQRCGRAGGAADGGRRRAEGRQWRSLGWADGAPGQQGQTGRQ